jgi:hypothetical protein
MHRIRLLSLTIVIVAVVAGLAVPAVFAKGNPHFLDNTLRFKGGSLIATGSVAGLANEVYWVVLSGTGTADATCVNPGGSKEVKGRNPVVVTAQDEDWVTTDRTGSASFSLEVDLTAADVLPSPSPKEAGCPNGNWTVVLGKVTWTKVCLFLYDMTGTELDRACQSGSFEF